MPAEPEEWAVPPGIRLYEWRRDSDLSMEQLTAELGISPEQYRLLTVGGYEIKPSFAKVLAKVTGIPSEEWNEMETGYRAALAAGAKVWLG